MNKLTKIIPISLLALPIVAFAQLDNTKEIINNAGGLVNDATIIVVAIALLVFFWGLMKFIVKAGDEAEVKKGKGLMIWGVVALFVMVSIWGIVYFIGEELFPGFDDSGYVAPPIPNFPKP